SAQQHRLARARPAGEHDQLAQADLERDVGDRGRHHPQIGVRDLLEREDAHRSIPLRSANGSNAHTTSATATAIVPAPTGACSVGSELNGARPATRAPMASAVIAIAEAANAMSWREYGFRRRVACSGRRAAPYPRTSRTAATSSARSSTPEV